MTQKLAYQGSEQQTAKAFGKRLPISTKQSIEVCKAIKGEKISRAKNILQDAIDKKVAIKFTRANEGAGHKPGVGPGKYPVKACKNILEVVQSAEANAQNQGLSSDLKVVHAAAQQGPRSYKYGRQRGRKEKSTHIEIVLQEVGARRTEDSEPEVEEEPETEEEPVEEQQDEEPESGDEEPEEKEETSEESEEPDEEEQVEKDIPARSTIENKTKDEIKDYAEEEYGIELSTNDLKKEMIDQLFKELEGDD